MKIRYIPGVIVVLVVSLVCLILGFSDDAQKTVKKSILLSTLNQTGTKPFYLKAMVAPSRDRDQASNRTGEIEIWWASPNRWKWEVRSPEFHQIAIVNGSKEWQKNDGDYFPEWLREISIALIEPVPPLEEVLTQVDQADVKRLMGSTYYQWTMTSTDGNVTAEMGAGISITDSTGLLFYGGGLGWGGLYKDYKSFRGRMVARTVSGGTPEVTARISTLQDLPDLPADFFDPQATVDNTSLLHTIVVEETELRKYLLPSGPVIWPPLQDGPLKGTLTTTIVVDRTGKVREIGPIVSSNPGVREAAGKAIAAMQFKPYLQNQVAVQVVSRFTMSFSTARPAGAEAFDSAHDYFERGRQISFPAAGKGKPYVLHAAFKTKVAAGTVEEGQYIDTWEKDDDWRREATLGKSRCIRSRHGDKRYRLLEGPDAAILQFVLRAMEPIPAIDTFVESDWKIKRDTAAGLETVRVLTGYESPEGILDPKQARGFWFDDTGRLLKTYFSGIETQRLDFEDFNGLQIAHTIKIMQNGSLALYIRVVDISELGEVPERTFTLPGHEWKRAFTDEVR